MMSSVIGTLNDDYFNDDASWMEDVKFSDNVDLMASCIAQESSLDMVNSYTGGVLFISGNF